MGSQLSLIPMFDLDIVVASANWLVKELNDGLKSKDRYGFSAFFEHNGIYIMAASTESGKTVWNALNSDGRTPKGFVANWRVWPAMMHDLNSKSI